MTMLQPAQKLVELRPYLTPEEFKQAVVITLDIESEADFLRKAWRGWSKYREIWRGLKMVPLDIHASQARDRITEHFQWNTFRFERPPRFIDTRTMRVVLIGPDSSPSVRRRFAAIYKEDVMWPEGMDTASQSASALTALSRHDRVDDSRARSVSADIARRALQKLVGVRA